MRFTKILKNPTGLLANMLRQIEFGGPLTVASYMQTCLAHPQRGYYSTRDPLDQSANSDFITSPEVHQIFGELLGAWIMQEWILAGSPQSLEYTELGPGRGTLAKDILTTVNELKQKVKFGSDLKIQINLIEISPVLARKQAEMLKAKITWLTDSPEDNTFMKATTDTDMEISWSKSLADVPLSNSISFIICHEFLDALPIHQFEKDTETSKWREVLIDMTDDKNELRFVRAPAETAAYKNLFPSFDDSDLEGKRRVEISPGVLYNIQEISSRIGQQGGNALIIDYGHQGEKEDTLRGFRNHKLVSVLEQPGDTDITADVNFDHVKVVANSCGLKTTEMINQKDFLKNMGIDTRLLMLLRKAQTAEERENLTKCHNFLMEEMGDRFKFMALSHPARAKTEFEVTGFYKIDQDLSAFMRAPRNVEPGSYNEPDKE